MRTVKQSGSHDSPGVKREDDRYEMGARTPLGSYMPHFAKAFDPIFVQRKESPRRRQ